MVAVVGGDTLLAKELVELLGESKPAPRLQLISAAVDGSYSAGCRRRDRGRDDAAFRRKAWRARG